jgi:transposase
MALPGPATERFFNQIKQYRRVATRYDKLAAEAAHPNVA